MVDTTTGQHNQQGAVLQKIVIGKLQTLTEQMGFDDATAYQKARRNGNINKMRQLDRKYGRPTGPRIPSDV